MYFPKMSQELLFFFGLELGFHAQNDNEFEDIHIE